MLRNVFDRLLTALVPPPCWFCGQTAGEPFCPGCLADLPWFTHCCERCGRPLVRPHDSAGDLRCARCPPALALFDRVWAPLSYEYPVDRLIAAAKFGRELATARLLGELMWRARQAPVPAGLPPGRRVRQERAPVLVPIPLHWRRHASRGFNQAEEMARALGHRLGLPVAAGLCRKRRATPEQSTLPAAARRRNVRDAFEVRGRNASARLDGATLILVDDVLTTGATAAAVAGPLRRAGVARLELWVLARAVARGRQAGGGQVVEERRKV